MECLPFPLENLLYTLQDPCSTGKTYHIDSEEMEDFVACIPRKVRKFFIINNFLFRTEKQHFLNCFKPAHGAGLVWKRPAVSRVVLSSRCSS